MVEYAAVGIALVAILGDARDVDTIGTESDEMGSICSYEIMIEGIASITLGNWLSEFIGRFSDIFIGLIPINVSEIIGVKTAMHLA